MADAKRQTGLGRGLASLIPTGPAKPRLGSDAADIVIGGKRNGDASGPGISTKGQGDKTTGNRSPGAASDGSGKTAGAPGSPSAAAGASAATKKAANPRTNGTGSAGSNGTPGATGNDGGMASGMERGAGSGGASGRENTSTITEETATYRELPVDIIDRNPKNPRQEFEQEALRELAHSIREFGMLQPIVVREKPESGRFELIMGERRLRAAQLGGVDVVPAIVRETDDDSMLRDALLENIHRVQLNPLEEGAAYQQLLDEFGVTQAELAKKLGRSRPVITNAIRLMNLPMAVQRRVAAGVLSQGHARAILGLTAGPEAQERLADRVVKEGLSVRATEEAVTLLNRGADDEAASQRGKRQLIAQPERLTTWASDFGDYLDTNVKVQMGSKKGKIVVEFAGMEDFDRISAMLKQAGQAGRDGDANHA